MDVKVVLVPIDFGVAAKAALQAAAGLAAKLDARLFLLHVLPERELEERANAHVPPRSVDLIYEDVQEELRATYGRAVPHDLRRFLRAGFLVGVGQAAAEIVTVAGQKGADLIIMGTHGRSGLAHVLLGSVAEKVVRTSRVPVMVLKGDGLK